MMISSLWPTSNVTYNTSACQYAGVMERSDSFDPRVTFLVDECQACRSVDGMHHLHYGYWHVLYATSMPSFCGWLTTTFGEEGLVTTSDWQSIHGQRIGDEKVHWMEFKVALVNIPPSAMGWQWDFFGAGLYACGPGWAASSYLSVIAICYGIYSSMILLSDLCWFSWTNVTTIRMTESDFRQFPDDQTDRRRDEGRLQIPDLMAIQFRKE